MRLVAEGGNVIGVDTNEAGLREMVEKAQAGAKILYDYLNDRSNPKTGSVSSETKPSAKPAPARKQTDAGRDTLTPTDRAPAWRNPSPHKDVRRAG